MLIPKATSIRYILMAEPKF